MNSSPSDPARKLIENLETKRPQINSHDFRFYNLAHFPLIIKNTFEKAPDCSICNDNINIIQKLVASLPECLEERIGRKEFDSQKEKITQHLQDEHNLRLANYYYSLYTLLGLLFGGIIGIILKLVISVSIWPILAIIGAIIGAFIGKKQEKQKNIENKLM